MNQEKQIEEIIEIGKRIKRVEPNPFLFAKIKAKIQSSDNNKIIPVKKVRLAVIGLAALCVLNLFVILSEGETKITEQTAVNNLELFPYDLY